MCFMCPCGNKFIEEAKKINLKDKAVIMPFFERKLFFHKCQKYQISGILIQTQGSCIHMFTTNVSAHGVGV